MLNVRCTICTAQYSWELEDSTALYASFAINYKYPHYAISKARLNITYALNTDLHSEGR